MGDSSLVRLGNFALRHYRLWGWTQIIFGVLMTGLSFLGGHHGDLFNIVFVVMPFVVLVSSGIHSLRTGPQLKALLESSRASRQA